MLPKLPSYPDGVENTGSMVGRYAAFIGGEMLRNVTLRGGGTIDGQGYTWWLRSGRLWKPKTILHTRPRLVQPAYSTGIRILGLTLKDSPFWAIHIYACDDVVVQGAPRLRRKEKALGWGSWDLRQPWQPAASADHTWSVP